MTSSVDSRVSIPQDVMTFVSKLLPQGSFHLAVSPDFPDDLPLTYLQERFAALSGEQKSLAYLLRWELANMDSAGVEGYRWGEIHFWTEPVKVARVLHRLGVLGTEGCTRIDYNLRLMGGGEKSSAGYFSLSEKSNRDPVGGWISYVNGMGTSHWRAGGDASQLSNLLGYGNNIHAVYLPTRQNAHRGDLSGFVMDALRYLSVAGGSHTRASCLIAQQWIDYLSREPTKSLLQTCHSEGAAHVNAALELLRIARADLISRLRIITFCPAKIILPREDEPLQVINLMKLDDFIPMRIGGGEHFLQYPSPHVQIVPHTCLYFTPHCHLSPDYVFAAKSYFDQFMHSGSIFP